MIVLYDLDTTSIPSLARNLCAELKAKGINVILVSIRGSKVRIDPDSTILLHLRRGPALLATRRLARSITREDPEFILSFVNGTNLATILATKLAGVKARVIVCEQNTFSLHEGFRKLFLVRRLLTRMLYKHADIIVVPSRGMKDDLLMLFPEMQGKVAVVPNPINVRELDLARATNEIVEHPWLQQEEIPVIVNVANLRPRKRHDTLVRAFAQLVQSTPAYLVIVGDAPLSAHRNLLGLVEELGIMDRVLFAGFQQNPHKYVKKASISVLSSEEEGFGMVIPEAMAMGVPVVSTDCPHGPREIITHGVDGLLVPVNDPVALCEAMRTLLVNDELRSRFAAKAVHRARSFFLSTVAQDYVDLMTTTRQSTHAG